jgi:hypothetical protein
LAPSWQFHRAPSFQESHNVRFYFHGCYVLPEQLGKSLNHRQTRDFGMDKKETNRTTLFCLRPLSQKRPMSGWPSLALYPGAVCVCGSCLFLLLLLPLQQHPKSVPKNRKYVSLVLFYFISVSSPQNQKSETNNFGEQQRQTLSGCIQFFSFFSFAVRV